MNNEDLISDGDPVVTSEPPLQMIRNSVNGTMEVNARYPTYEEIKEAQQQLAHNYSCNRDHCTSEERAVIDAAVARLESRQQTGEEYWEYDTELNRATGVLLAARAKEGK